MSAIMDFEGLEQDRAKGARAIMDELVGMVKDKKLEPEIRLRAAKRFEGFSDSYMHMYFHQQMGDKMPDMNKSGNKFNDDIRRLQNGED